MRTYIHAEKAFVTQLVKNTRQLVEDETAGLKVKLAAIQSAVQQNTRRLTSLRETRAKTTAHDRIVQIDRHITLRERATGYLLATAKFLVHKKKHLNTLVERPPAFAVPAWNNEKEASTPKEGFPFMEFSS